MSEIAGILGGATTELVLRALGMARTMALKALDIGSER